MRHPRESNVKSFPILWEVRDLPEDEPASPGRGRIRVRDEKDMRRKGREKSFVCEKLECVCGEFCTKVRDKSDL